MVGLQKFVNVTYTTLIVVVCHGKLKRLWICASLQDTYVYTDMQQEKACRHLLKLTMPVLNYSDAGSNLCLQFWFLLPLEGCTFDNPLQLEHPKM
jgi:hypothetical protein